MAAKPHRGPGGQATTGKAANATATGTGTGTGTGTASDIQTLCSLQDWQAALAQPALLVLLGGAHCGVCTALKPRIAHLLQHTPALAGLVLASVDCEQAPAVCAQLGVFSVPVLRLYLDGRLALDFGRHFSLSVVRDGLVRQLELHGGADLDPDLDPDLGRGQRGAAGSAFSAFATSGERSGEEQP